MPMKKIITSILFLLLLMPIKFHAADEALMIVSHPGEDANTQINLSWHMDESIKDGKVIFTEERDTNWDNAITINGEFERNTTFKNKVFNHYKVNLTNLKPNTKYKYKVGATTFSDEQYFKTGSNRFSFAWVSDWHTWVSSPSRNEANTNLVNTMIRAERQISMIFSTGDEVSYGYDYNGWLLNHSQPQFKNYAKAAAIGNHDYQNYSGEPESYEYFKSVNNYPMNGYEGQEGVSYYFKYGKTLFIMLNSHDATVKGNIEARRWASKVIEDNPSDFVVVAMHYNFFNGADGVSYQYHVWKDFFDRNNVDLALSGHNHIYVRTHRLFEGALNEEKGTVFIQNASSDNARGRAMADNYINKNIIAHRFTEGPYTVGGVILSVDENKITTKLINRSGDILDSVDIQKREKAPFDKQAFLDSFSYYQHGGVAYVSQSDLGVNHVEHIEYKSNDTLVGVNTFYKKDLSIFLLDTVNETLDVTVSFRDRSTETFTLTLMNDNFLSLKDLAVNKSSSYILTWIYDGPSQDGYVFIDDTFYKKVNLIDQGVDLGLIDPLAVISIRQSESTSTARHYVLYNTFGDANIDGIIDEGDLRHLLNGYFDRIPLTENILYFSDINNDGIIDSYDITYIHLYIQGLIDSINHKEISVTFLDIHGNVIDVIKATAGDVITPPTYDELGYTFIMWDKDLSGVYQDLVVRPIMGR